MIRLIPNKTIKTFVNASIRTNKHRNILTILTISLTTCLFMSTILYFIGYREAAKKDAIGRYQACLVDVNQEIINQLLNDKSIEKIGLTYYLEDFHIDDYKITFIYMDENNLKLNKYPDIKGNLPQKTDEVAVVSSYLNYINSNLNLGDKIELCIGDIEKEYTISGIIPEESSGRQFNIVVSKELIGLYDNTPLYSAYIRLNSSEGMSTDLLKKELINIADKVGIDTKYLVFSSLYLFLMEQSVSQDLSIIISVCIIITLACSLVIYSLFYSSVIGKTNEYGRLRIIGATKKQIKNIVIMEGRYLSYIGIPCGVVFGSLIAYLLVPSGWMLINNLFAAIITSLAIYLIVILSIHKPMKLAAKVTPLEATRYISYAETIKKTKTKRTYRRMSPYRIAIINLARNKKKTVLTIGSLSVCGILLMSSSAYLNSINFEDMARAEFPYGELKIRLGSSGLGSYDSKEYYKLQRNNHLNSELIELLYNIKGVEHIKKYEGLMLDVELPNGFSESFVIDGYNRLDNLLFEENLIQGTVDYEILTKENGIILNNMNEWKTLFGWKIKIGDKINISTISGKKMEFTVLGIVNPFIRYGGTNMFFIPDDNLQSLARNSDNINYQIVIKTNTDSVEKTEKEVRNTISSYADLTISTLKDSTSRFENFLEDQKTPIYLITILIGFFGIFNLINTHITNLLVRKKEISVFQILGLTNVQLFQMLICEGLLYSFSTSIISMTIGTGCGLLLCKVFNIIGAFGTVNYCFPLMQITIYFTLLVVIQLVISIMSIKFYKKQALVDRIKVSPM